MMMSRFDFLGNNYKTRMKAKNSEKKIIWIKLSMFFRFVGTLYFQNDCQ